MHRFAIRLDVLRERERDFGIDGDCRLPQKLIPHLLQLHSASSNDLQPTSPPTTRIETRLRLRHHVVQGVSQEAVAQGR